MKLFVHQVSHLLFQGRYAILLLLILLLASSCSEDPEACEENNTGTIVVENSRSTGRIKIFFNEEPRSGNVPGDLNIKPGEKANIQQLAGQHIIYALLDTSTCSGERCIIRNETLPERTVDLSSCQDLNLVY